jgi:hypothetical protein
VASPGRRKRLSHDDEGKVFLGCGGTRTAPVFFGNPVLEPGKRVAGKDHAVVVFEIVGVLAVTQLAVYNLRFGSGDFTEHFVFHGVAPSFAIIERAS